MATVAIPPSGGGGKKRGTVHNISLKQIQANEELQPRKRIDASIVKEYADDMTEGHEFEPVVLFYDGTDYWLADGFHRYWAALKAKLEFLRAYVLPGTREDALLHSLGANATHGQRRSREDKQRAIERMLNHPEWCRWSNNTIAQKLKVSPGTVSRYRENSPGLLGHNVTLRLSSDGELVDTASRVVREEHDDAEPGSYASRAATFAMPPTPMTREEMQKKYVEKIARHLRKADAAIRTFVATDIGSADIVGSDRVYLFVTPSDSHYLFSVVGRAILMGHVLGSRSPVLVGHFSRPLIKTIRIVESTDLVTFATPESLIAGDA